MTSLYSLCRVSLIAAATMIPAAAMTSNQADFVNQMYADLLHRPADAASLSRVQAMFGAGATRAQVAAFVTGSTEFRAIQVESYYQTYLQRSPTSSESSLGMEVTSNTLQAVVLGTDEYFRRSGGSNDMFLQRLYTDLLNRVPAPGEVRSAQEALAMGQTRASVAAGLIGSAERQKIAVTHLYYLVLRRSPSSQELDKMVAALASGAGESFVIDQLAGSDEYLKFAVQAAGHTITPCV